MKKIDLEFKGDLFDSASKIIEVLKKNNFQAYIVGGAVRDSLLGGIIQEFDLVTDAKPEEIKKLFKKTVLVGEQFGVIVVNDYTYAIELATMRKDYNYCDSRHPESVEYTNSIEEDSKRRDFTINAMYYDIEEKKLYDFNNSLQDLKNKVIRTVGDPAERFREDELRIIRACRFVSQLDFTLSMDLKDSIVKLREEAIDILDAVSVERKRDELIKILLTKKPSLAFWEMKNLGILKDFVPVLESLVGVEQPKNYHPEGDVWTHTMLAIDIASREFNLRYKELGVDETRFEEKKIILMLAVLFHDIAKPKTISFEDRIRFNKHDVVGGELTKQVMTELKFSKKLMKAVSCMVKNHMKVGIADKLRVYKRKLLMASEHFDLEILLNLADSLASHGDISMYEFLRQSYKEFLEEKSLPAPIVTGKFLISKGFRPSTLFSEIINEAYKLQLEGLLKTKEDIDEFLQKYNC